MASSSDGVLFPFFQEGIVSGKSYLLMFLKKKLHKTSLSGGVFPPLPIPSQDGGWGGGGGVSTLPP